MVYALYNIAATIVAPFGAAWLAVNPAHRLLLARFAPPIPSLPSPRPFWVHACSVGETGAAKPVIEHMKARWPGVPILLTVSTAAAMQFAKTSLPEIPVAWLPFDHPAMVRRFVRRLNPRALLLIETELWPNVLRETRGAGAPVLLVNGRLSDKYLHRYQRFRRLLKPIAAQLSAAGMQNEEYAARLQSLGIDPARIRVTGCTKFDGVRTEIDPSTLAALREDLGIAAGDPVLLFGSTRPGDEALAATCWRALKDTFPTLRLIVAPRHLDRLPEALAAFDGEPVIQRSRGREGVRPQGRCVIFLDTVGELAAVYALGTIAVIGGSFYPGVNGHNPVEPAALGVPTVFGPFMRNFIDPAKELLARNGALQVPRPEDLPAVLARLLHDPAERAQIAANGREAVTANQGAIERNLDLLASLI